MFAAMRTVNQKGWNARGGRLRARFAALSFGASGTNAHVVLESAAPAEEAVGKPCERLGADDLDGFSQGCA